MCVLVFFFFQAEDGIRDYKVTGVQTCALPIFGETVDVDGKRAYVLTLATREQHIRRGKATSNICTNQALIALAANIYLSLMGKQGLREVGMQCLQKTAYLREKLREIALLEMPFSGPVYNEFVGRRPLPRAEI